MVINNGEKDKAIVPTGEIGEQKPFVETFSGETKKDGLARRIERYLKGYEFLAALRTAKETGNFEKIKDLYKRNCIDPDNDRSVFQTIGEQNWSNVFSELKPGDSIAMLLAPGANFLSIKELNNIFGEAGADAIRDERNEMIQESAEKYGYEVLFLDFSTVILKDKTGGDPETFRENLEGLCKVIDEHASGFICGLSSQVRDEVHEDDKRRIISNFLDNLTNKDKTKGGYQMTFGVDSILSTEEVDLLEIVFSLSHCLQYAQWARENYSRQEPGDSIGYGEVYDQEMIVGFFQEIEKARTDLIDRDSEFEKPKTIKIDGEEYDVINETEEGEIELVIKTLRAYRKRKINPIGQENVFNFLNLYIKRLNLFDLIKPYLNGELNEELRDRLLSEAGIVKNFEKWINGEGDIKGEDVDILIKMLEDDPKDRNCSSRGVFYGECLERKGYFVKFDVVDVWVNKIRNFEKISQNIDFNDFDGRETQEKILAATDEITLKLRQVRAIIREEFGSRNLEAGGDENFVFAGSEKFNPDLLKRVIFKIQERCVAEAGFNIRAIFTEKSGNTTDDVAWDIISLDKGIDRAKDKEELDRKEKGNVSYFCVEVKGEDVEVWVN